MELRLDQSNVLVFDPDLGGRILSLRLANHVIIRAEKPYDSPASGSFTMFPWVSKIESNPYAKHTFPQMHGLCMNTPRKYEVNKLSQNCLQVTLQQSDNSQHRHKFIEIWYLTPGKLAMQLKVIKHEDDPNPFCFGYHPYLQLDDQDLNDLTIVTNINKIVKFDQRILPIYPFQYEQILIDSKGSYNNLLQGGSYFELYSHKGVHVKIQSDMGYWQIYTPPDHKRIAIQPVTFGGNVYTINAAKNGIWPLPQHGTSIISVWED